MDQPKAIRSRSTALLCAAIAVLAAAALLCLTGCFEKYVIVKADAVVTDGALDANQAITVTADRGNYYAFTSAAGEGYVAKSAVKTASQAKAEAEQAAARSSYRPKSTPQGSSTPSKPSTPSSADGSDISLEGLSIFEVEKAYAAETAVDIAAAPATAAAAFQAEEATVLANTPIVVTFVFRGDKVQKLEEPENGVMKVKVEESGVEGYIDERLVRAEDEEAPEAYLAYTIVDAKAFSDFTCLTELPALTPNTQVNVLDQLGDVLLVEANGSTFFMPAAMVSLQQVEVPKATTGGGSSSKSKAPAQKQQSTPAAPSEPEWTEEKL